MTDDASAAAPIEELMDRVPDARERTREGIEQARRGEGIPLGALADPPPRGPRERTR